MMNPNIDREFLPTDTLTEIPNILVVEDDDIERFGWVEKVSPSLTNASLSVYESMNVAHAEWIRLVAEGHMPRALIIDWMSPIGSMGCIESQTPSGTQYCIDGAAFVLWCAIKSVEDDEGMFVAYSSSPEMVKQDIGGWDKSYIDRVHIVDKGEVSSQELAEWVLAHDDFTSQEGHP